MNHIEYSWQSGDGLKFYAQGWLPDGSPRAVVCLVHGIGEHSGRYAHVGAALVAAGYALLGFDLRGHGKTEGQRGHSPSFEAYMADIDTHLAQVNGRFPNPPRFLYGHSLGGIMVLNYALRRKPALAGVVASASALRTALEQQKAKVAMAKILGTLVPTMTLATGLDSNTLSRDPQVIQTYLADPLVHDKFSLGASKGVVEAIAWAFEHAAEFPLPLLLMHGVDDALGFARGSEEFARLVPAGCCTLKLWPGLKHEIHNEPEKEQVLAYMISWLDSKL